MGMGYAVLIGYGAIGLLSLAGAFTLRVMYVSEVRLQRRKDKAEKEVPMQW